MSPTADAESGAPVVVSSTTTTYEYAASPEQTSTTTTDAKPSFSGAQMGAPAQGQATPPAAPPTTTANAGAKNHQKAVWSLVCAIIGFLFAGIILGPVAILLAMQAKKEIKESPSKYKGEGLANAGLIVGIIAFIISLILIIFII